MSMINTIEQSLMDLRSGKLAASVAQKAAASQAGITQEEKSDDFTKCEEYRNLIEQPKSFSAISVPIWCNWVTKNTTQALVLAQTCYWFDVTKDPTSATDGLPRTLRKGHFRVDNRTQEFRCWMISYQEMAQQCCLSYEQVRRALQYLVKNQLVQSEHASQAQNSLRRSQCPYEASTYQNAKCYRVNPEGLVCALVDYLRQMGLIAPGELTELDQPDDWRQLEHKLGTFVADANHKNYAKKYSTRTAMRDFFSGNIDSLDVKEPENDQPISMPSRSTEFVDSHLQKVLYRMEMWVTVPHWAIQMVEGSLNDALVLARIFNWQKYLRRQYKGYLWLEKTHEQLAGEAGMLVPGKPRNRYRRVTRSLERLEKSGLIEKLPPKQEHRNRFTRIRLVTQEFERRMSEIHDENWWAPKGYEV